jgi:hypothetical protein
MSSKVTASDPVVQRLERELASLRLEVGALRGRVEALEGSAAQDSVSDYSLITEQPAPNSNSVPSGESRTAGYCVGTAREEICRAIGQWLRRALSGLPRGPSGRERIDLASRFYLVCRDFRGNDHNPPLFFSSWKAAKDLCFHQGEPGDSVFIGLPTKTEAVICVEAAGLQLPPSLRGQ